MEHRMVALLRGVNVGGVRFAMRDLAAALEAVGFAGVRMVLASGNVVLTTDLGASAVAARVHEVIAERFGFDIAVLAVDGATLRAAIEGYPFDIAADRHAYVVFGESRAALAELRESAEVDAALEQVATGDGVLYWDAPKGQTLTTAFGRSYGRRQRSGAVTTRNRATLTKIAAVL